MSEPDAKARRPGLFSGMSALTAVAGGVMTLVTGYVGVLSTINANRLKAIEGDLTNLKEERTFSRVLYDEYKTILADKSLDEQGRIDRLYALLTLTRLTGKDQQALRQEWAQLIAAQADRNQAVLKSRSAASGDAPVAVAAQVSQYQALRAAANATARNYNWSNYDIDVFYCRDVPNARALRLSADRILAIRARDPAATGRWRLREITRSNQHAKDLGSGYVIRWDHEDEAPVAAALQGAVREALPSGPEFTVQDTGVRSSRWYLSVFLCPGWNA